MSADWRAALERVYRRVLMLVARCRVTSSMDGGPVRQLQVQFSADEVHDGVEQIQEYGFASRPLPGCDAAALFVAGDRVQGIIVGTNDQRYRPKGLQPGDVMIYDWRGNSILLSASGIKAVTPETFRVEAKNIELHATDNFRFDVNGHGQHWFPNKVDNWTVGASAGTNHPITPPEIS